MLNNGTYMIADCCDYVPGKQALFSGTPPFNSSAWTVVGTGKFDDNDEEGLTVLPNGNVLTVDAYHNTGTCDTNSEIFNAITLTWSSAGSRIVQLPDCSGFKSFELGPQVLRPDFANQWQWRQRPGIWRHHAGDGAYRDLQYVHVNLDGRSRNPLDRRHTLHSRRRPRRDLPSGNVLFAASPRWTGAEGTSGAFPNPTNFWEVGPNSGGNVITAITQNPDGPFVNSFEWNFLVLPTSQVLAVETYAPNVWIYTPLAGAPNASWLPVINTSPTHVTRAHTYALTGTQFNGLSQGAAYGDDVQANTNYPLVKIVNRVSGHVFYEKPSVSTRCRWRATPPLRQTLRCLARPRPVRVRSM